MNPLRPQRFTDTASAGKTEREEVVYRIVAEHLGVPVKEIHSHTRLMPASVPFYKFLIRSNEFYENGMTIVDMVKDIEKTLHLHLPDFDVGKCTTVGKLLQLVNGPQIERS